MRFELTSHKNLEPIVLWNKASELWNRAIGADGDQHRKALRQVIGDHMEAVGESIDTAVDFGCGNGYFTEIIAARAHTTYGYDPSSGMISEANAKTRTGVEFTNDLEYLTSVASATYVLSSYVMHDASDITEHVSHLAAISQNGATLTVIMMHPVTIYHKYLEELSIDYNSPSSFVLKDLGSSISDLPYYHRPLSQYVNELYRNSFTILDMRELTVDKQDQPDVLVMRLGYQINTI